MAVLLCILYGSCPILQLLYTGDSNPRPLTQKDLARRVYESTTAVRRTCLSSDLPLNQTDRQTKPNQTELQLIRVGSAVIWCFCVVFNLLRNKKKEVVMMWLIYALYICICVCRCEVWSGSGYHCL